MREYFLMVASSKEWRGVLKFLDRERKSAKSRVGRVSFSGIPMAKRILKRGAEESSLRKAGGGTES